jgi:outer membrane protein OmpA-like peptidoglycan-associated protein
MTNRMVVAYLGAALLSVGAGFASADDERAGEWSWGLYGGAYIPDSDLLDTGPTGGIRFGYRVDDHVALSTSLGYASVEGDDGSGVDEIKVDIDAILLDLNAWYIFRPQSRLSFMIGAGPGWAWVDGSATNNAGNNLDSGHATDDSLTANIAFGPMIKIGDSLNLRLMTRFRYFDQRTGNEDGIDREITLGIVFPLGAKKAEPVVAAAPAPAPAPKPAPVVAAKCADGDNDGVCDSADQCPNTPAGKRVGPAGCDCDFTLNLQFAFNSAELSELDKGELDTLAETLRNPKLGFIEAQVNGYTDSTGTDEYNLGLSQRRADSVMAYLQAKGVGEKFVAKGYGEADPTASNDTDEGRAQNRRVVIRRTDCG